MLKKELNDYFISQGLNPQTQKEEPLFKALIEVMNKTNFAFAQEYHSHKGLVEHILQYAYSGKRVRCCEIADILMLFIDEAGNMRYTFLQNTRDKKTSYCSASPLRKFKAAPVQWDLLHYRCMLSNSLKTGLPIDCLSSAILNSAATYGIFVNESSSGCVEMSYNIARDLIPVTPSAIGEKSHKRTYNISSDYNTVILNGGYLEIQGTATLDDFELAAQAMLVGTPIESNNCAHKKFAEIALSYALTCLTEQRENAEPREGREDYLRLVFNCAERYRVELRGKVKLPYHLAVVKAKKKFLATFDRPGLDTVGDCKIIGNRTEILNKLNDENAIVIIDPAIVTDEIKLFLLSSDDKNNFVAVGCGCGLKFIKCKEFFK